MSDSERGPPAARQSGEVRTDRTDESKQAKRAYQRPALTVYGSVARLTHAVTATGGDGMGMMMMASDPAAKERIARIGEHPDGFGLYLFHYKPEFRDRFGHGRQFGVMADEVERFAPLAVSRDADGYRMVDYALLSVTRGRG